MTIVTRTMTPIKNICITGIILPFYFFNSLTTILFPSTDKTIISEPFSINSPSLTAKTRLSAIRIHPEGCKSVSAIPSFPLYDSHPKLFEKPSVFF